MNFNDHSRLSGSHAFLSASGYHWLNYDDEKLITTFKNAEAAKKGTELHAFAEQCIRLGQKLPKSQKTLNMYVNDAIGFKMTPEVVLYYSENCFGTTDSICFDHDILRIHDYKSGITPAKMEQLYIYDALFCHEYKVDPMKITTVNRIYQNNDIWEEIPDGTMIKEIMDIIVRFDSILESLQSGDERLWIS